MLLSLCLPFLCNVFINPSQATSCYSTRSGRSQESLLFYNACIICVYTGWFFGKYNFAFSLRVRGKDQYYSSVCKLNTEWSCCQLGLTKRLERGSMILSEWNKIQIPAPLNLSALLIYQIYLIFAKNWCKKTPKQNKQQKRTKCHCKVGLCDF